MSTPKFKTGDLVFLNSFGSVVADVENCKVGIVVSGPYDLYYPYNDPEYTKLDYLGYDVMLCGEVIKRIPQDFLDRMGDENHVENPKDLEEIFKRRKLK